MVDLKLEKSLCFDVSVHVTFPPWTTKRRTSILDRLAEALTPDLLGCDGPDFIADEAAVTVEDEEDDTLLAATFVVAVLVRLTGAEDAEAEEFDDDEEVVELLNIDRESSMFFVGVVV